MNSEFFRLSMGLWRQRKKEKTIKNGADSHNIGFRTVINGFSKTKKLELQLKMISDLSIFV